MKTNLIVLAMMGVILASPALSQNVVVQTQPLPRPVTDASGSISVTDTFQQVWEQQAGPPGVAPIRDNCAIQNNGTHDMWVYFGLLASAVKTSSIVVTPGEFLNCGGSVVATSAVAVTGTSGDAFTALLGGAPILNSSPTVTVAAVNTDSNLITVAGSAISLGQKAMAASLPVVLPSNQSAIPVTLPTYTAITASATGTTLATVATLAGTSGKTTYICGFTITAEATAATVGAAVVSGTVTGSLNYRQNVGLSPATATLGQNFSPCVPASASNTAIVVTSVAASTGGNTAVAAWGYQQ